MPVLVDGAMFSCGDPHAMQGDGEVCVCALECDMWATLRLSIENRTIATPMFSNSGPLTGLVDSAGHTATMGLHADLYEGARIAVRAMGRSPRCRQRHLARGRLCGRESDR